MARGELEKVGYTQEQDAACLDYHVVMWHPGAKLPRVVVRYGIRSSFDVVSFTLKCDSLVTFCSVFQRRFGYAVSTGPIEGTPGGPYARCSLAIGVPPGLVFYAAERRGYRGMVPVTLSEEEQIRLAEAQTLWMKKKREYKSETRGMRLAIQCAQRMVELVGQDMAASCAMEGERGFWMMRNKAGQVQWARQNNLGLGWANHDHHTFRSSREHFSALIEILETFGFCCRERFYAGKEAGWGAQVLEQQGSGLVVFADVDLAPDEVEVDFAHMPLSLRRKLGTIGLWCALHGESILQAGMHHLEIQCSFNKLREDLQKEGIEVMEPFSDFPYLRQAFTKGERWTVQRSRLEGLLVTKSITPEEYEIFRKQGAIGSHLEHLERKGGFKGFNQSAVSDILGRVDPRKAHI